MADINHSSFAYSHKPRRNKLWKELQANKAVVDEWLLGLGVLSVFKQGRYVIEARSGRSVVYYPLVGYWGFLGEADRRKVETMGQGDGEAFVAWYSSTVDGHNG